MRQLESLRNLSSNVCAVDSEVRASVSKEGVTNLPEGLALEHSPTTPRAVNQARVAAGGTGVTELSSPQPVG